MDNLKTLPPGKYWVGDLCYVMEEVWDEVCELTFPEDSDEQVEGIFTLKDGRKFALFGTKYGDGVYTGDDGNDYGVDSGTLGLILESEIHMSVEGNNKDLGHCFEIQRAFECSSTEDGEISLGSVRIYTGDQDEEEEEEEEEY